MTAHFEGNSIAITNGGETLGNAPLMCGPPYADDNYIFMAIPNVGKTTNNDILKIRPPSVLVNSGNPNTNGINTAPDEAVKTKTNLNVVTNAIVLPIPEP